MTILLLLIQISGYKAEISPAILFPTNQPTQHYFSQIYNIQASGYKKVNNEFSPGIFVDFLKKKSNPYYNPYFQNAELLLKLFVYGAGACFDYKITNNFSVGSGLGLYGVNFKYPYAGNNSQVLYFDKTKTYLGFYTAFSIFQQIGKWQIGTSLKATVIGARENYYDLLIYPPLYDLTPYFPTPITGITLSVNLGYEP